MTRDACPAMLGLAAGALVLLAAAHALALEVQITTVRASEHGPSDAQLIDLRPRLRRLVGYRSFQVVGKERRRCAWQTSEAFAIPGGRMLHVVPKGMRDQAVVMSVKLMDGSRALPRGRSSSCCERRTEMGSWVEEIGNQLWGVAEAFGAEMRGQGLLSLLRPVAPFNRPSFLAPAVTVGALITFLMLSGVAVTALGALLAALLALYLLLVEVFGVTVELHPLGVR